MPKLPYLFVFFAFLTTAVSSQSLPIDNSVTLLADKIKITEDNILIAEGNVEARRGNQLFKGYKADF